MIEGMNLPDDKKKLADDLEHLPVTPENVKRMAEEYLRVTDPDIRERIEEFLFFKVFREDSTLFEEWDKVCAAPVISAWGEISEELLEKIIRTIPGVDNLTLLFDYSPFLQKNIEEKKHIRDAYVERIMGSGDDHGPRDGLCDHRRKAGFRNVGADLLLRVRRQADQAGSDKNHRRMSLSEESVFG